MEIAKIGEITEIVEEDHRHRNQDMAVKAL
jgi:hypothetical protein